MSDSNGVVDRAPRLRTTCQTCGTTVTGQDGVVHVSMSDVAAYERYWSEHDASRTAGGVVGIGLTELLDSPEPAAWTVLCNSCRPTDHDCVGCYSFDVGRMTSWAALLSWTAHLMEKTWLAATNWGDVVRHATRAGERGITSVTPGLDVDP